ncbi:MAG: hypothetical protein H2205_00205 [Citrobacter pasteurii]|uniref:hypothetical protein n=1 Tax=Citrobacter pasteurii TaxID=1563222 RepID=UPI0018263243|nr:hypothetical protein [Citrobacter pasteurii]MBA4710908.1 hypothetical protein [Citrobacter pasteurii]
MKTAAEIREMRNVFVIIINLLVTLWELKVNIADERGETRGGREPAGGNVIAGVVSVINTIETVSAGI